MLATVSCRWSRAHNAAWTQTTSATTAATERIEINPRGAENRDRTRPLGPTKIVYERTLVDGVFQVAASHGGFKTATTQKKISSAAI
jgi:hypothetical protein